MSPKMCCLEGEDQHRPHVKGSIKWQYGNWNGSSSAGHLEDTAEVEASRGVPIPTQKIPKFCLDPEQDNFGAQIPSVLTIPLPAGQVLLFKSLGINFPGKSGAGSMPAPNTNPIWDKLSASALEGTQTDPRELNGTWSPLMATMHLESSTEE